MSDLFTVCVTHYKQMNFVYAAIDSVLKQDYSNIELMVADDGSDEFDKEGIEKYIKENKKSNIKKVTILAGGENVGTVKNLNNAIKNAKGKYITFFAADDQLSNEKVITNYYEAFKNNNKEVITAQAYLYDKHLIKNEGPAVDSKKALKYNELKPIEVFYYVAQSCFYASGATAYKMSLFDRLGLFDERYLLVEDWSYYLHLLKNDVQIYFVDFPALNHRDGGVSHTAKLTPVVAKYYDDIVKIYENELLNDMPDIDDYKKMDIYSKCKKDFAWIVNLKGGDINYYNGLVDESMNKYIGSKSKITKYKLKKHAKNFFVIHFYQKIRDLYKNNPLFLMNFIVWLFVNIFVLKDFYSSADSTTIVLALFGSFVLSALGIKTLARIGDLTAYCLPITFAIMYCFNSFGIKDYCLIILVSVLLYGFIFYLLYVLRILIGKIKH